MNIKSDDDYSDNNPVTSMNGMEYYSYGKNQYKKKIKGISFSNQSKKIIIDALGVCFIGAIVILILSLFRTRDLTDYLSSSEEVFLKKAGKRNILCEDMKGKIPQYTDGADIEVYGDKGVYTLHIDGEYEGVHITDKHCMIYGIKIGSDEAFMLQDMTYVYDGRNKTLKNPFDGESWIYYFENSKYNDCLFICIDAVTNKVSSITYHKDCKKATEKLSFWP